MATPTRRQFFARTGGFLIGFSLVDSAIAPRLMADTPPPPSPGRLDAWLRIEKDEIITVFTDKVDIGMGLQTAFSQIVAEELDVAPHRVVFVMGDTALTPDQGGVGGSTSISAGAKPLRNASATARSLLVQMASTRLGVAPDRLQVKNGIVSVAGDESKSVSYGVLAAAGDLKESLRISGRGFNLNVEGSGKPKDPSTYSVVGKPLRRADLEAKILGQAQYSTDVRVPGMLHARVVRPPGIGATLVSVDESAARKIPGYVKTVVKGNFVGVVAGGEWPALRAARELKVTWSNPAAEFPADVYQHIRSATPKVSREGLTRGDAAGALAAAARRIEAGYEWPFQAHATMGPGCAVADFRPDGVTTVWCGSQKNHALQKGLAGLLHVDLDRVRVIWVQDAGSYGRAGYEDAAADAVLLSQAVGKPVRVQWSRSDMTAWGSKGPAATVDLTAGLAADGTVTAFQFTSRTLSGSEVLYLPDTAGNFLAARLMGIANTSGGNEFVQLGDSCPAYEIPNVHSMAHVVPSFAPASPLAATHLRDPNGPAATFAVESFMDELAAATGSDPIEFRLKYLKDPRAKAVLTAAADRAQWNPRQSKKRDSAEVAAGRGVAYALRGGTYVATIAEVEVNRRTGAIQVKRLVCAHDCGLIVNPDGLRGVVAANLIQSLSRALKEEVTFDRNKVTTVDWTTYRVARAPDIPEHVDIVLLNHPELPPSGAGEPSSRPTAAAIGNAVFDAVGVRIRRAPLTPERITAALKV